MTKCSRTLRRGRFRRRLRNISTSTITRGLFCCRRMGRLHLEGDRGRGRGTGNSQTGEAMIKRFALLTLCTAQVVAAQIPQREFAARRDSLAKRIDSGVVVAFGGRTPVTDFGPFHQIPAFHYLTERSEVG